MIMVMSTKKYKFEKNSKLRESHFISSTIQITEKKTFKKKGIMIDSGKVRCTEEHSQSNPNIYPKNKSACKWGRKIGSIKTCGDCPFGVQLLEVTPAHRKYLETWEERLNQWNWPKENINKISLLIKK
jgi:hypothetical protein